MNIIIKSSENDYTHIFVVEGKKKIDISSLIVDYNFFENADGFKQLNLTVVQNVDVLVDTNISDNDLINLKKLVNVKMKRRK